MLTRVGGTQLARVCAGRACPDTCVRVETVALTGAVGAGESRDKAPPVVWIDGQAGSSSLLLFTWLFFIVLESIGLVWLAV